MSPAPVHFYYPALDGHASPEEAARRLVADTRNAETAVCWALRPWAALSDRGLPVRLATRLPAAGIVVAPRCELAWSERPSPELLLVCARADGGEHPWAQLELVQNPAQADTRDGRVFMPHWPQPGIRPRDPARGKRFERVAYVGSSANLPPELLAPAWTETLRGIGLTWIVRNAGRDDLGDYRDIDAIVAVRDFQGRPHHDKPASKLVGAWRGGVPAIVGPESAYAAAGERARDFLVAQSPAEVLGHLRSLQAEPSRRAALIARGAALAVAYEEPALLARWERLVTNGAPARLAWWRQLGPTGRAAYFARRQLRLRWRALRARFGMPPP